MRLHKIWWRSNLFQFDPAFLLLSRNMPQRNLLARSALIPLGGCTVPLINTVLQKYKFFVADFSTPNDSSMTRFLIHINIRQSHMNWGIWHSSRWWVTYFLCTSFDQVHPNFDLGFQEVRNQNMDDTLQTLHVQTMPFWDFEEPRLHSLSGC